jgi:hypothetical protein
LNSKASEAIADTITTLVNNGIEEYFAFMNKTNIRTFLWIIVSLQIICSVAKFISGFYLIHLVVTSLFIVPIVYEKNNKVIDEYIAKGVELIVYVFGKILHVIPAYDNLKKSKIKKH